MAKRRKKKKKKSHHPPTPTKRCLLAEAILMEADDLLAEDQWDEAQLLLEEAIEEYPYNAEMLSLLDACYLNHQELHRAVRTLERCIALSGAPHEAYYNLVPAYTGVGALIAAHWALQQSLQDEAIARLRHVLEEIDPQNFHALGSMVRVLVAKGHWEEALPYAERLAQLPIENGSQRLKVAEAFATLDDDQKVYDLRS